ncbi:MAG TPA: PP2C family protein-serine/threonine phosphatase [Bryobacteraceae bacterium]
MNGIKRDKRRFWRSLPRSSLVKLSLAIFFTFASVGFVVDLFHPDSDPLSSLAVWSIFDALSAVAFLLVTMRSPKRLAILIPAVAAGAALLIFFLPSQGGTPAIPDAIRRRLILDAVLIMGLIYVGYSLFVMFIETEGFKHLRDQAEVDLAERLQATLVPPLSMRTAWLEVEARSMPSSQMGGDLADAVACGDWVTCYVADVSGHGIAAGVLMGMVKTAVRMALLRGDALDGILRSLHGVLPGLKEPNAYVTVAGLRFREPRVAEYATAGHLPILHYRHKARATHRLSIEQFPVGMIPSADYHAATAECEHGDIFVMLTDGIVEVADARDEEFGSERIEELLSQNASRPLSEIADVMLRAATAHGPQMDDQTILLARITA